MKISTEELEKIKQSHKAKDLQDIIHEEQENQDEAKSFTDTKSNEGGDQNFISDMVESHQVSATTEAKRESVYQRLRAELSNTAKKLRNAIRPMNLEVRSLANEVGGLEVDYKKINNRIDKDVDVWDRRTQDIAKAEVENEHQDQEENKSFIHLVKTGIWGRRRKRKAKKHMGQVDLGKATEDPDRPVSYINRLSHMREDHSHFDGREM